MVVAGEDGPSLLGRNWLHLLRLNWSAILTLKDNNLTMLLNKHDKVFNSLCKDFMPRKNGEANLL